MKESVGGHYYTAEEVRQRLELAKKDGEVFRDSRGAYRHAVGVSGTSGIPGFQGFSGYQGHVFIDSIDPYEKKVEQFLPGAHSVIKPRPFSVRAFIKEAVNELKVYFKPANKKEIQHAE